MKTIVAGTALAALLCACAANPPPDALSAAPRAEGAPQAAAKAPGDPNAQICRREDAPLASHIPQRTCHTRAEWAEIDKARAAGVDRATQQIDAARGLQ